MRKERRMTYEWVYITDKGGKRRINQDSVLLKKALWGGEEIALAVLCDGMGGLERGELASASAVRAFSRWFTEELPGLGFHPLGEQELFSSWDRLLGRLNEKIGAYGQRQSLSLGTTVTAVLFWRGRYYTAHVGDCRLYEVTDRIFLLTKDQTLVQREVDLGDLTPEEAKKEAKSHVLLQCVGASKEVAPAYGTGRIRKCACYLLCCDGFWRMVSDQELSGALALGKKNPARLRRKLKEIICKNRARGEQDNISVVGILCSGKNGSGEDNA